LVQSFYGTLPPVSAKMIAPSAEVREEKRKVEDKKAAAVMPAYTVLTAEDLPF